MWKGDRRSPFGKRTTREDQEGKRGLMDATDLEFVPRAVRDKLDRAAVKIHLAEWQALSLDERRALYGMPCESPGEIVRFRDRLDTLVLQRCGQRPRKL
jgi:hypothetical protein